MNVSANQSGVFPEHGLIEELNNSEFRRLIPTLIFMVIIMLVGVSGNGFVCYIYGFKYKKRTSPKWFIFFLACLDIVFCLLIIPSDIASLRQQYTFTDPAWCKIATFIILCANIALGIILVIVAIDRYRKSCQPHGWQISYEKARTFSVLAIIVSCLTASPVFVVYDINEYKLPGYDVMASECVYGHSQNDFIYVLTGMVIFCCGLIIICILYAFTGSELTSRSNKKCSQRARARKATFIMFLISISFVIGYLPSLGLILARSLKYDFSESMTDIERAVYKCIVRSYYSIYAINPFIYCANDSKFRNSCIDVLVKLKGRLTSMCSRV